MSGVNSWGCEHQDSARTPATTKAYQEGYAQIDWSKHNRDTQKGSTGGQCGQVQDPVPVQGDVISS